jgi:hypothetical protein
MKGEANLTPGHPPDSEKKIKGNDKLWRRVLYCDWMPAEGWTLKTGAYKTWLERASDLKVQ